MRRVLHATQDVLPAKAYSAAKALLLTVGVAIMSGALLLVIFYVISSPTFGWTGALVTGDTQTVMCDHISSASFLCVA